MASRKQLIEWWRHAVIYHVFVNRFAGVTRAELAGKPEFVGGNLKAIRSCLPYIASLSDVLWLSPFNLTVAYHGYSITDYEAIDPRFGTQADLIDLLSDANELGLKVICEMVPNHCARQHPWFQDAITDAASKFRDWFCFLEYPNQYECFHSFTDLPKLNMAHKPTVEAVRAAARKWLKLGMAGFRIDHVLGLSNEQMRELLAPLKKEFPEAVYFGEAWLLGNETSRDISRLRVGDEAMIRSWMLHPEQMYLNYQGLLDGAINFEAAFMLESYAMATDSSQSDKLEQDLKNQAKAFDNSFLLPTHLDNHDMDRFLFRVGQDIACLKKAAQLQFELNQPAIVYYGTEVGMTQTGSLNDFESYGDLVARQPMIWDETKQNKELLEFYRDLAARRKHRRQKALAE